MMVVKLKVYLIVCIYVSVLTRQCMGYSVAGVSKLTKIYEQSFIPFLSPSRKVALQAIDVEFHRKITALVGPSGGLHYWPYSLTNL